MTEIKLGKLRNVKFGLGGYQDCSIGLHASIVGEGWGVDISKSAWDSNLIKHSKNAEWTEETRDRQFSEIVHFISNTLYKAKVDSIEKLEGIPVEATFDGHVLRSWRILTEVI